MAVSMVEVSRVDSDGVWLLTHNEELFMSFEDFPWFKNQSLRAVLHVQEPSPDHFYWPEIDVDLTQASGAISVASQEISHLNLE